MGKFEARLYPFGKVYDFFQQNLAYFSKNSLGVAFTATGVHLSGPFGDSVAAVMSAKIIRVVFPVWGKRKVVDSGEIEILTILACLPRLLETSDRDLVKFFGCTFT